MEYDYEQIKKKLSSVDIHLKNRIQHGHGIRILNQDLWETIISFIISANNNIPRIKGIIERISKEYGKEIVWNERKYYTFPTPGELGQASVRDLRKLGLGFRDSRVYETTKILQGNVGVADPCYSATELGAKGLASLQYETDINKIKHILLSLPGVGPKVADCIMLFRTWQKRGVPY